MLGDSDRVEWIVIVPADFLHIKMTKDTTKYNVEQLHTIGIVHQTSVGDGHRGNRSICWPRHCYRHRLDNAMCVCVCVCVCVRA